VSGMQKLYLVSTADRFELPLFVSPYVSEIAEKFGTSEKRIWYETHSTRAKKQQQGKLRGFKFELITVNEKEGAYV